MSRNGIFVAVVGPSGAGKDTLLNGAAQALSGRHDIHFVRRIITRSADGATEDHDTLDADAFKAAELRGEFCLTWTANGLHYALPRSAHDDLLGAKTVVANLSRSMLEEAVSVFGALVLVEVTAKTAVLAQRLAGRGREGADDVEKRLARSRAFTIPPAVVRHVVIDNSGALEEGVHRLTEVLASARSSYTARLGDFAR